MSDERDGEHIGADRAGGEKSRGTGIGCGSGGYHVVYKNDLFPPHRFAPAPAHAERFGDVRLTRLLCQPDLSGRPPYALQGRHGGRDAGCPA